MIIVFRYLTKQLLLSMLAVTGILMMVFMSARFIKYLGEAASGNISSNILFTLMGYRMPEFLQLILPLALYLGILLAYGRMYLESEMTVLFACGMSHRRLMLLTSGAGLIVMLIVAFMSLYLTPLGLTRVSQILQDQTKITEFELLVPGRFQSLRSGERVTYTEALSDDKREMQNVFIAELNDKERGVSITYARSGTQTVNDKTGERFLVLHDGSRFQGNPGKLDYRVVQFDQYGLKIAEPSAERQQMWDEATPTLDLFGSKNPKFQSMLQWRLSMFILVPIVSLMAVPLSKANPRQGRFFQLFPGILLYVTYIGLLIACRDLLQKQKIPVWLGMWWVHGLFLGLVLFMQFGMDALRRRRITRAQA